jgi:hypothetical protein
MNAHKLNVTIDQETGELHTLDRCPGFHPELQKGCGPSSVACLDGAIDDMSSYPRGTNALLAHFDLLIGSHQVMGLSGFLQQPSGSGSSIRLHANGALFTVDDSAQPQPVWAVTVRDRRQETLYVSVYTTLQAAVAAYRHEVAESYDGTECVLGLMDHGIGEPCECAGVTETQLDLRALIPRSEHSLVTAFPAQCMCGAQVAATGLPGEHPSLGEHLDDVVHETLRAGQLQQAALSELALLAPSWRGNLADLVISANTNAQRAPRSPRSAGTSPDRSAPLGGARRRVPRQMPEQPQA